MTPLVAAAAVTAALTFFEDSAESASPRGAPRYYSGSDLTAASLPAPVQPTFTPPMPVRLSAQETTSRWAVIRSRVAAREKPTIAARILTYLERLTPERTSNLVLVLGTESDASGQLWVHVRLPILPNNTTGWIPRTALRGYEFVHTRLVVDVERLTATLYRDGRSVFQADIGVGKLAWPTPKGEFYIRNKLVSFESPFYGPLAFGTSAQSAVLTDWPAGGFIGIHGTNRPDLLPGRVSHGCIRLRNTDIVRLARLMPVGTPLTIT